MEAETCEAIAPFNLMFNTVPWAGLAYSDPLRSPQPSSLALPPHTHYATGHGFIREIARKEGARCVALHENGFHTGQDLTTITVLCV